MSSRLRESLGVLGPVLLIIFGIIVNAIGYAMVRDVGGEIESAQPAAETMSRIAVILVLGGLAFGFMTLSRGAGAAGGGKSDG